MMCWIHKLRAMLSGRATENHTARCPKCAADAASDDGLEKRLRNSAPRAEAPFGFANRVIARAARELNSEPDVSRVPWLTFAVGAAAFLLIALVLIQQNANRIKVAPSAVQTRTLPSQRPQVLLADLPKISPAQIGTLGAKLDQPLEKELHYMISDTRQAIQFVASNFIPDER